MKYLGGSLLFLIDKIFGLEAINVVGYFINVVHSRFLGNSSHCFISACLGSSFPLCLHVMISFGLFHYFLLLLVICR